VEIETITDDAKIAISGILNRSLLVEYDFILNYPRIIDRLVNYDDIHDEQLIGDLDRLGKESMKHFNDSIKLIEKLGGEPKWKLGAIERLEDAEKLLTLQLEKEHIAASLYKEAKLVATRNKKKIKVQDFFGRLIRMREELAEDVVSVDDIIEIFDRGIIDENRHIRLVKDSLATLNMLMNKRTE
jgi:bacterioferritin (cytochrome b1)